MTDEMTPLMTDDEFRARNADINTIGSGMLWSLLGLLTPVFLYFFSKRISPSINPWVAAIVGTIILFIPCVGFILGIAIIVYGFKRVGGKFIAGQIIFYVILMVIALVLAVVVPMMITPTAGSVAPSTAPVEFSAAPAPVPAPTPAVADNNIRNFTLINHTGKNIDNIYLAPSSDSDWTEEDRVTDGSVLDQQSMEIEFTGYDSAVDLWDLKAEAGDMDYEWTGIDLTTISSLTLKLENGRPIASVNAGAE